MTISLAFLAPNLVKAAVERRLPRGIGIERLRDPSTEWSRQFEALGLNPKPADAASDILDSETPRHIALIADDVAALVSPGANRP